MLGLYVGSCRITQDRRIVWDPTNPTIWLDFFFFKWDKFRYDNPPKLTSPTGYQKTNNELKSQIYLYVNIKSQKKPIVLKFNIFKNKT